MGLDVLTVSSKGQIVLPSAMRKSLAIEAGSKFVAWQSGDDTIMLKMIHLPKEEDLQDQADEEDVLSEEDVVAAVKEIRTRRRLAVHS